MKRLQFICVLVVMLLGVKSVNAQIALQYRDTTICPGQTIQMCAAFSANPNPLNTDDFFSAAVNIGFPFVYFGNTYTQFIASGNNFISFNVTKSTLYSSFTWAGATAAGDLNNSILLAFMDTDLSQGGKIRTQTFGTTPNRRCIVEYCRVPKFGGVCNAFQVTNQLILYEGSNIIEVHTGSIPGTPTCPSTTPGWAVQGVRDPSSTVQIYTPPRGPADFWGSVGATSTSTRYTPNGTGSYLVDTTIAYNPWIMIEADSASSLKWYREGEPNLPVAVGACATVSPTADINYYVVKYSGGAGCDGGTQTFQDTVFIHYGTSYDTTAVEVCAGSTYNWFGRELYMPGPYDTLLQSNMGCDSFLRLNLIVNPLPNVVIKGSATVNICEGSSAVLELKNPQDHVTYQWYKDGAPVAGETGPAITASAAGSYKVEATTDKGCKLFSDPFTLIVNPNPVAGIEPITGDIICAYDTLEIKGTPGPSYDYRWSPEKPFRIITGAEGQTVKGVFIDPTLVTLTVYNQFGCYDTATVTVQTKPCCEVFTPSAFTPNGDGMNDYFNPQLKPGQIVLNLQIFDRYGKMVYNNTNIKKGWDGKYENGEEASTDTYMYFIKYTCADGKLYEKKEAVSLIR
jgi:gliding motility-associated-like protein